MHWLMAPKGNGPDLHWGDGAEDPCENGEILFSIGLPKKAPTQFFSWKWTCFALQLQVGTMGYKVKFQQFKLRVKMLASFYLFSS